MPVMELRAFESARILQMLIYGSYRLHNYIHAKENRCQEMIKKQTIVACDIFKKYTVQQRYYDIIMIL